MCIIGFIRRLFGMRRKISLYIADRKVDLDDQSLVLFNYTMEDMQNPTIVKNSYSHQVTIKGTPQNNKVFGDIFRPDRIVAYNGTSAGTDFNPSQRTPFTILNEMNEVLESGYCKLDSIDRKKGETEYHVTLFGGLGGFLYSLAYDADGNKRTLADLDYLGTDNTESELDFTINAQTVAAAWTPDDYPEVMDSKWKVINFALAYNGIPDGNFAADKALVVPSRIGLQDTIGAYGLKGGYALVNLAQKYDEWAVKDLRSYLQRPVFSIRAFLEAVKKPMNNGGYVVNMPFLEKQDFSVYGRMLWMTLPMIPSIGTVKQTSGDLSLSLTSSYTTSNAIGRYAISGDLPFGTQVNASLNFMLQYNIPSASAATLRRAETLDLTYSVEGRQSVIFVQVVAHGNDDTIVGGSKVKVICSQVSLSPSEVAERCGYVPQFVNGDETFDQDLVTEETFTKSGTSYTFSKALGFTVSAKDVSYYTVHVTSYNVTTHRVKGSTMNEITSVTGTGSPLARLYNGYDNAYNPTGAKVTSNATMTDTITYTSAESLRSGAHITKAMLLSTSNTPADYLLSFCKMFGLHILFDQASKEVTILDRNDLYQDETIDLTRRVDTSKGIGIVPFVFDAKWYAFRQEGVGGAFFDEYKSVHGRDYGVQMVNTGYDFNAETRNLMEGNVFRNAATILDRSRYYTTIKEGGHLVPSVFIEHGHTYTLWDAQGDATEEDIPVPSDSATIVYLNGYNNDGYDIETARKMEFRTKDGKPIDGTGVLVFREGWNSYPYFNLTDDIPAMDAINDGVPCWIINPGTSAGVRIPVFQRYIYAAEWDIVYSLDFGVPAEMDIPQIEYPEDTTIYSKFWKNYLRDRYDVNTKVMTCRVNFGGYQVGQELLRKFYWYDNALWVLNRISNYSLTTYDPVECEFVQVQDKNNYLNGQL